jgi:hypothetical protein
VWKVASVVTALVLVAGCGSTSDSGAGGAAASTTTNSTDANVSRAADAMAATLQEIATDVEALRAVCAAAVGQTSTAEQVAACDAGYMTGILDQAATLIAAGHQLADDLAGAGLPPSVRGTPELLEEVERLRDAAAECPDETMGTCAVTRADVLDEMDRAIALLPSWQAVT